jgi:putative peptide zinc metalloprotease protein
MTDPSATRPPKLRSDLVVSEQQQPKKIYFIFKNPTTSRFFRFHKPEYFITHQLDSETTLEAVEEKAREKLGADLAPDAVGQFVEALRRLGLPGYRGASARALAAVDGSAGASSICASQPSTRPLAGAPRSEAGAPLHPSFHSVVGAAHRPRRRRRLLNWSEIRQDLRGLWRFDALLLAWVVILLITIIHEFTHGLTCKHFGGAIHEINFMLIYFQPAFYCNVSNAWLFRDKPAQL